MIRQRVTDYVCDGARDGCACARREARGGHAPAFLSMRRILLPVTCETWAMPCESRRITPICEGVRPFLASLVTWSRTSVGEVFSHDGGVRRYGRADLEIPLLRGAKRAAGLDARKYAARQRGGGGSGGAFPLRGARERRVGEARGVPLAVHTPHGEESSVACAASLLCSGVKRACKEARDERRSESEWRWRG